MKKRIGRTGVIRRFPNLIENNKEEGYEMYNQSCVASSIPQPLLERELNRVTNTLSDLMCDLDAFLSRLEPICLPNIPLPTGPENRKDVVIPETRGKVIDQLDQVCERIQQARKSIAFTQDHLTL